MFLAKFLFLSVSGRVIRDPRGLRRSLFKLLPAWPLCEHESPLSLSFHSEGPDLSYLNFSWLLGIRWAHVRPIQAANGHVIIK